MKKLLTLILAIVCAFTAVACAPVAPVDPEDPVEENNGTVISTLYKMGKSNYKIVLPEEPTTEEVFAADDFNVLFSEATGYSFEVIYDNDAEITPDTTNNYIFLGRTKQLKEIINAETPAIVIDDDKFNLSGYTMKTIDNNLYVCGRMQNISYGSIYAMYTLLSDLLGFEYYAEDVYELDKSVSEVSLIEYDFTDIPAIDRRQPGFNCMRTSQENLHRLRLQPIKSSSSVMYLTHSHTFWESVQGLVDNPDCQGWFTPDKKSICYSNDELFAYHVEYAINKLKYNPIGDMFSWGAADNYVICPCLNCTAKIAEYGNFTGLNIVYMKQIAAKVQEWIDENQPGRKVTHEIGAYAVTLNPPVKIDKETGAIGPFCDEVILTDGLGVDWAPINADFGYAMNDPDCSANATEVGIIERWQSLFVNAKPRFSVWQYGGNCKLFWVNHGNISVYKAIL